MCLSPVSSQFTLLTISVQFQQADIFCPSPIPQLILEKKLKSSQVNTILNIILSSFFSEKQCCWFISWQKMHLCFSPGFCMMFDVLNLHFVWNKIYLLLVVCISCCSLVAVLFHVLFLNKAKECFGCSKSSSSFQQGVSAISQVIH